MTESRPNAVNFYDLLRDTFTRLPKRKGDQATFLNLLEDSPYLRKSSTELTEAIDSCQKLLNEKDPCFLSIFKKGFFDFLQ